MSKCFLITCLSTSLNGFNGCLCVMGLSSWVCCFEGKLTAASRTRSSFIKQNTLTDSLPNFLLAAQVILLPSAFSIGSLPTYIIWAITSWNWEFSVRETNVFFFSWRHHQRCLHAVDEAHHHQMNPCFRAGRLRPYLMFVLFFQAKKIKK